MTTNSSNSTALDTAATQGHINIVNLLLDTGVDLVKIAPNNGKTVLHSAARMGHVDVGKSLLTNEITLGQAYIADNAAFILFLVFDSHALFISLAAAAVQTSLIVVEQKVKSLMVFVMNKLMWLACLFISVSFISLTFVVVGKNDLWLAWCAVAIGATIMIGTIGSMCYCIVVHRIEEKNLRSLRKGVCLWLWARDT